MSVRVSPFHRVVKKMCRLNSSEAKYIIVRRSIIGMSHGLTNSALALLPFTAEAEVWHQRLWRIEIHTIQKSDISSVKLTDFNGDFKKHLTSIHVPVRQSTQNKCILFKNLHLSLSSFVYTHRNCFAVMAERDGIRKTQQMNYRWFELNPGLLLGR